ncbi:MAG TPA: hypothetical protein VH331_14045 [Allosphingosinicella sp.]|jgi:hypothetical protein|nr:hypothetical protein [Allosphingosinicella sp.]
MHFHLPKPLHGWRAFIGEVGVITIGVLIALGLEQIVQTVHERRVAHEARDAIDLEIAGVLGDLQKRAATEGCIARRLTELDRFVAAATVGHAPPLLWIARPQVWTIETSVWNSASQAGRTALFAPQDQSDYADLYASLEVIGQIEGREQELWAQLRALEGQSTISPAATFAIRSLISQARSADWRIRAEYDQTKLAAASHHIRPVEDTHFKGSVAICVPSNTPRDRALQIIGSQYGEP